MNIYEKIQLGKVKLLESDIKKTGRNNFSKYDYFELGDFLPTAIVILNDLKVFTYPTFTKESAILNVINIEDPNERFQLESPMASADLKGMHDIQNLGAVITYQRRYLYICLFDISENDYLDAVAGKDSKIKVTSKSSTPLSITNKNDRVYIGEIIPKTKTPDIISDDELPFDELIDAIDDNSEDIVDPLELKKLYIICYTDGVANWKPLNEITKKYGYGKATEIKNKHFNLIMDELKTAFTI